MENILTIIGLILNFIGAWCLAYELLWGYPKDNRRIILQNQLSNLEEFFIQMDGIIDGWAEPPYTREEKEAEKQKVRDDKRDNVENLEAKISACGEGHREKSFYIALLGVVLLSAGFVFQLIDLL